MNTVLSGSRKHPQFFMYPYSSHDMFIRRERGRENCGKTWCLPKIWCTILRPEDLSRTCLNLPSHRMSSSGLVWVWGPASRSLLLSAPKLLPGSLRGKSVESFPDCNGGTFGSREMGVLLFDWEKYHLNMSCLNEEKEKEKKEWGMKRKRKKQKDSNQTVNQFQRI